MKRLFLILSIVLFAASAGAETLTLEKAVSLALANNPGLQARGAEAKAAKERIVQAYTPENPSVGVKFERTPFNTPNVRNAMSTNYMVSQNIPFPGKLISAGKAAKNEWKALTNIQKQTALDVAAEVKKTFYNIIFIEKEVELEKQNKNLFSRYKAIAETKYATGKTTFDDPIKASISESDYEIKLAELTAERSALIANLGYLTGSGLSDDIKFKSPLPSSFEYTLEDIKALAFKNQPSLKAASDLKTAAKNKSTAAKQQYIPDIKTALEYNQLKDQENAWTAAFEISVPLWFFGRQQPAIRESSALKAAAAKNYEDAYNNLSSAITEAYEKIRSSARLIDIYKKTILPKARASLKSAETSYSGGKMDFLNLLESARASKEYEIDYWRARTDYESSIAIMETLTGGSI